MRQKIEALSVRRIGRVGEAFCSFILEANGVAVSNLDIEGADLVASAPSGRLLTVEVKSALRQQSDGCYKFYVRNFAAEVLALVDLRQRLCLFWPPPPEGKASMSLSPAHFSIEAEAKTLHEMFFT